MNIIEIIDLYRKHDFKMFTKPYDVNFGGYRSKDLESGEFNDYLFAFCIDRNGALISTIVPATTDAGIYYRLKPMHKDGTAIIAGGMQHFGCFQYQNPRIDGKIGHFGQECLRQIGNMTYVRDNNKDSKLDTDGKKEVDLFYTNCHFMGKTIDTPVGKWSAGCVGSSYTFLRKVLDVCKYQIANNLGDIFSFTLFEEE